MKYKETLEEVLLNLRCIDVTENEQVESYVNDSIRIIKKALEETAPEVPVQEQYVGKCKSCGRENKINVSQSHGEILKFCMECGEKIEYKKERINYEINRNC